MNQLKQKKRQSQIIAKIIEAGMHIEKRPTHIIDSGSITIEGSSLGFQWGYTVHLGINYAISQAHKDKYNSRRSRISMSAASAFTDPYSIHNCLDRFEKEQSAQK